MSGHVLVLIVEDDQPQRHFFKILAETLHFNTIIVETGQEALEALKQCKFDAVFMDVRMPGMDGLDCTRAIRLCEKETGEHVPIIGVTACAYIKDKQLCLAAGMDDYIAKPFTLDEVESKLAKWTLFHSIFDQLKALELGTP